MGVAREDVEDQLRAVDDPCVQRPFQVALLGGRQFVVEDNEIRATRRDRAFQFLQLAAADERSRVGLLTPLEKLGNNAAAGADGQFAQFGHGFFRREVARFFRMTMQVSGRGVTRDASAGRHLT